MKSKNANIEEPIGGNGQTSSTTFTLELPTANGNPIASYQPDIIDALRGLILRLGIKEQFPRSIALTSALRGEGVTYLAHALAATLANDTEANVGLVDLNWWWPSDQSYSPAENGGLGSLFSDDVNRDDVIIPSGWSNLSFIPAGKLDILNRSKVARSEKLKDVITALNKRFDHLIIDVPAIQSTSDSVPLLSLAEGCCLVIRQGGTHLEDVQLALDTISHLRIFGVLFNQVKFATPTLLRKLIPQI